MRGDDAGERADGVAVEAEPHAAAPLLALRDVGKRFDDGGASRWVLRDVAATVRPGRALALWGPSGAGKSTLLNLIAGFLTPDAGEIVFNAPGSDRFAVSNASERERARYRRQHLGFVFQFFNLVPTLTIRENVLLPIELNAPRATSRQVKRQALEQRRAEALARIHALGLGHCCDRFPATLSGGEQQRAALARALAHGPSLVLADEPTGNLDRRNAERVTEMMWQLLADAGCAVVLATHNERLAERADARIELD